MVLIPFVDSTVKPPMANGQIGDGVYSLIVPPNRAHVPRSIQTSLWPMGRSERRARKMTRTTLNTEYAINIL